LGAGVGKCASSRARFDGPGVGGEKVAAPRGPDAGGRRCGRRNVRGGLGYQQSRSIHGADIAEAGEHVGGREGCGELVLAPAPASVPALFPTSIPVAADTGGNLPMDVDEVDNSEEKEVTQLLQV